MNRRTFALTITLCAALAACGGEDATPDTLAAGQSTTMSHGQTLHVPSGTTIDSNGNQVVVTGHQNTIHVAAGATVSVQPGATGPADNLVIAD